MDDSQRILSRGSGPLDAPIMFVGEAPGRLGADETSIPFHGDAAGQNFEQYIKFVGLSRYAIFITNAVLCNPRDDKGNNATPLPIEIGNCSSYLKNQIEIIDPKIIVTLGSKSLESLKNIEKHNLTLKANVRTANVWNSRILIPLYHPGQRALIHRSASNQRSDYKFIMDQYTQMSLGSRLASDVGKEDVMKIVNFIFNIKSMMSYFSLHKIFYLSEIRYLDEYGIRMSNAYIVRQKDGPYCVDLHYKKIRKSFQNIKEENIGGKLYLRRSKAVEFWGNESSADSDLPESVRKVILDVLEKYKDYSDSQLKTAVYLTRPMRNILKAEKRDNRNLYNVSVM